MVGHTWFLLALLGMSIVVLIILINSRLRLHPFVALLVVSVGTGLIANEPAKDLAKSIEDGAGSILGNVGVTLALGTMLGRLLADSGATDRIAAAVVARSNTRTLPWLMALAAFIIGIPMFFEVGLIVLLPLVFSVAQRIKATGAAHGSPYTLLAIPSIAALATLHGMLPPHPGPLIAVAGLHADLGKTIVIGLACAIPTVIASGPLFARFMAPRVHIEPDAALVSQFTRPPPIDRPSTPIGGAGVAVGGIGRTTTPSGHDMAKSHTRSSVPVGLAVTAILIPVALMLLRTIAEVLLPAGNPIRAAALLIGEPVIAMLIGFGFALFALALFRGRSGEAVRRSISESLQPVVGILLIIGGGGAYNEVLEDSGMTKAVATAASQMSINVLLLAWILALVLSASTGSATVGIVAATGIVAPLMAGTDAWFPSLAVVAIGAGSIGLNYVNHAGFWLVKESFGMSMGQALKVHTSVQTLVSVIGLGMVMLLSIIT